MLPIDAPAGLSYKAILTVMNVCRSTGLITSLMTDIAHCEMRFKNTIDDLTEFMHANDLPIPLKVKLRNYYALKYPTMKIYDDVSVLESLPYGLEVFILISNLNLRAPGVLFLYETRQRVRMQWNMRIKCTCLPAYSKLNATLMII